MYYEQNQNCDAPNLLILAPSLILAKSEMALAERFTEHECRQQFHSVFWRNARTIESMKSQNPLQ